MFYFKMNVMNDIKQMTGKDVDTLSPWFFTNVLYCCYLDPNTPKNIKAIILVTLKLLNGKSDDGIEPDADLKQEVLNSTLAQAAYYILPEHIIAAMSIPKEI